MSLAQSSTDLVEDVKRIVLNYISLPSDLHALCLVSRGWAFVAKEGLYTDIVLDIRFHVGQLATFERCLHNGASDQLRFAQSLSLYDAPVYTKLATAENHDKTASDPNALELSERRQAILLRILKLFPENRLCTFRHISHSMLSTDCIDYLEVHQKSIKNLHITQCDPLRLVRPSMHNLTAGFSGTEGYTSTLVRFMGSLPPLNSLSINFWRHWTEDSARYWNDDPRDPPDSYKVRARSISIHGCIPEGLMCYLPKVIDWSLVTSLSLLNFDLHLLWWIYTRHHPRNLTRLQLSAMTTWLSYDSFRGIFEQNENLQHVHLSMWRWSDRPPPENIDELTDSSDQNLFLWPLRHKLRSLVLHDPLRNYSFFDINELNEEDEDDSDEDDDSVDENDLFSIHGHISPGWLHHVCRNYPHLQQLGLKASEAHPSATSQPISNNEHVLNYLEPISNLGQLRLLCLYQERLHAAIPGKVRTPIQIADDVLQFATLFFQWAHTHCPRLDVLVWGSYGGASVRDQAMKLGGEYKCAVEHVPQFFFVKREGRDVNGNHHVFASSVTQLRVVDEFPDLDLLTYDPECYMLHRYANHI